MSDTFYSAQDEQAAAQWRRQGDTDRAARAAQAQALRRLHEQANGVLQQLPFAWQPAVVVPKFAAPSAWERLSLPAVHIGLLQPAQIRPISGPLQARRAGDWLCRRALDESTGELRYETQAAEPYSDGTPGPGQYYRQQPTCKHCLKWAHVLLHG